MSAKTNDTLYLSAGGILLAGACVWAFLQQSDISAFSEPLNAPVSGSPYEPAEIKIADLETNTWARPESQAAGPDWLYQVFTPPVIYYNIESKRFTVTVPRYEQKVGPGDPVDPLPPVKFGLELVKVTQPLFRLQLVGYVGEGATARGNFENQLTGATLFGATGKKIPDLNLEVVSFVAERRRTKVQGGTEIVETICNAVVRDTVTGVETKLDHKVRTPEGPLEVTFKNELDGTLLTAKTGDTVTVGAHSFQVGELQTTPPSAVVTKSGGDLAAPESHTLLIPPPPPPPPVPGENGEMPPAEGGFPPSPDRMGPPPGGFSGF